MSEKNHGHAHGNKHHQAPKWKPHTDWRLWAVVIMLFAMVIYVMTLDEEVQPAGQGDRVPAASP